MQYILTKEEYEGLKNGHTEEFQKWVRRAQNLHSMLIAAKGYPCSTHSYCDGCELEENDTCFRDRHYGK